MRRALFSLSSIALFFPIRPADACSCPRSGVEVSPGPRTPAPLNTTVQVVWAKSLAVDEDSILIRPRGGEGLECERTFLASADLRMIELRPKHALAARTRHEVVLSSNGGKAAVVGEFTTGEGVDIRAPSWSGLASAAFIRSKAVCCTCAADGLYALLDLGHEPDDEFRFGIWAAPSGDLDYETAPIVILRAFGTKLHVGHSSKCLPANFTFPAGKSRLRIGVIPIDLAGNRGRPSEVEIDLARPLDGPHH